jgi:hypothetical protein
MKSLLLILVLSNSCFAMLPDSLHIKFAKDLIQKISPHKELLQELVVTDIAALQRDDPGEIHIFNGLLRNILQEIALDYESVLQHYYACLHKIVCYMRMKQMSCTYLMPLEPETKTWQLAMVEEQVFKQKIKEKFPTLESEWAVIIPEFKKFLITVQQQSLAKHEQ